MNTKMIKLLSASVVVAMTLSSMPAQAQQVVTTSVNARAGLAPLVTVSCDPVNFGVWRIPPRSTGGVTEIGLTVAANNAAAATTATAIGNAVNVALASGYSAPSAGTCRISGATTVSSTIRTAISGNTSLTMGGVAILSLNAPATAAALVANVGLGGTGAVIDASGSGSFRIEGTLTIPETVVAANFGGYQTNAAATVSVTDAI